MLQQASTGFRSRKRLTVSIVGAAVLTVGAATIYATRPLPAEQPLMRAMDVPMETWRPQPIPRATPPIYMAARNALIAAGVDEDKVDSPAADLAAAIEHSINARTDELWWYGKIAAASLVPLWVLALVALLRHRKDPVDLWSLRMLVNDADRVAREREYP